MSLEFFEWHEKHFWHISGWRIMVWFFVRKAVVRVLAMEFMYVFVTSIEQFLKRTLDKLLCKIHGSLKHWNYWFESHALLGCSPHFDFTLIICSNGLCDISISTEAVLQNVWRNHYFRIVPSVGGSWKGFGFFFCLFVKWGRGPYRKFRHAAVCTPPVDLLKSVVLSLGGSTDM
jgi:hypothetical protein